MNSNRKSIKSKKKSKKKPIKKQINEDWTLIIDDDDFQIINTNTKSYNETIKKADTIFNNSVKNLKSLKKNTTYTSVDKINEEVYKSIKVLEGLYVSNAYFSEKQKNEFEKRLREYYDFYERISRLSLDLKKKEDLKIKQMVDDMKRENERRRNELYNKLETIIVPTKVYKSKRRKSRKYRTKYIKRIKN